MASDNGIVLMLHMFGYFVSSSCCCFFSVRSSTSSSQSIPKWLRCSLMLHLYWFWSFGQAQAQPQVSIFVAQTKWMCSIHCFSPYTFCVSVCFFFLHRILNETNKTKEKKIECAHGLLIITHSVVSLFKSNAVCRLVDRSVGIPDILFFIYPYTYRYAFYHDVNWAWLFGCNVHLHAASSK